MILENRVQATPDRLALVDADEGRTVTYKSLDSAVERVATALESEVPDTARVGTVCTATPEFVVTVHAAMRLGWTVVGLDPALPGTELERRIDRAEVDAIARDGSTTAETVPGLPSVAIDTLDAFSESRPSNKSGDRARSGHVPGDASTDRVQEPSATDGDAPRTTVPNETELDETVVILFTSGTTGTPQAVQLTRRNLRANAVASAFRLGVSPGDRWLCCLPVHHMGGLAPVFRTALYGTTLVVQRQFDAESTGEILRDRQITGVSLVPTQLKRLLDGDAPLDELETVLVGGAPTPDSLRERALDHEVPLYPTYGMTETASQIATATPDECRTHEGTVGQPLCGVDLTIVSDGDDCPVGETGEIVVDGPPVTPGYLDERATAEAFGPHGFHTGDIGYRAGDGRLWVVGREDEMIITGGELVAPQTVADTISEHPGVEEVSVVGLPHQEWGEIVGALIVPQGESDIDTRAIEAFCRDRLADHQRPRAIAIEEELPRTVSGTVDRAAVRSHLTDE